MAWHRQENKVTIHLQLTGQQGGLLKKITCQQKPKGPRIGERTERPTRNSMNKTGTDT